MLPKNSPYNAATALREASCLLHPTASLFLLLTAHLRHPRPVPHIRHSSPNQRESCLESVAVFSGSASPVFLAPLWPIFWNIVMWIHVFLLHFDTSYPPRKFFLLKNYPPLRVVKSVRDACVCIKAEKRVIKLAAILLSYSSSRFFGAAKKTGIFSISNQKTDNRCQNAPHHLLPCQ